MRDPNSSPPSDKSVGVSTAEPVLQTGDIQADVLLGINMKQHLIVVYLDVFDAEKAKAWLREQVLPRVTSADNMRSFRERFREARVAEEAHAKPILPQSATLNISFSFAGLTAINAPELDKFKGPQGFGTAFSLGLEERAALLGAVDGLRGPGDRHDAATQTWQHLRGLLNLDAAAGQALDLVDHDPLLADDEAH